MTDHRIQGLSRRDFIRGVVVGGVSLSLSNASGWSFASPPAGGKAKVVIGKSARIIDDGGRVSQDVVDSTLTAVMKKYTGAGSGKAAWGEFFSPKDVVGIKMNVMMTATHAEVVRSIVKSLLEIGIPQDSIIIWDRDRAGFGLEGVTKRETRMGYAANHVSRIVTDRATALINVPGLKSHWLSGIAVAIKNWCGAVDAISVSDQNVAFVIHGDSCADMGRLNAIPEIKNKCRLVLVDALRPLFHGGPQVDPRYLWNNGELMVSTDPVAIDSVCLKLIQDKRDSFQGSHWPISPPPKHVLLASTKYGLGEADRSKIDVQRVEVA
jgi:uncharacterized protein (DUF362 family)